MAESLVVSPVGSNIKSRNAYLRMKSCSPKFKNALRQRYREKVESDRLRVLDGFRKTNIQSEQNEKGCGNISNSHTPVKCRYSLDEILWRNQYVNIDEELEMEEVVDQELTQFENWLLQEYESIWSEEVKEEVIITCPLCCCGQFEVNNSSCGGRVFCTKCWVTFSTQRSMSEIQSDIFSEVDEHNSQCYCNPSFVNVPGDDAHSNLCIVCDNCGYLQIIM